MSDIAVELRDVSKTYDGARQEQSVRAVHHINLAVRAGEFFTLLGPSGCGKTTTLRMIAGFEVPTSGEIFIQGKPMSHVPPYRRPVNTVFQNYALFPHLTIEENVAFGLRVKGVPKAEQERRVREALELVRLPNLGHRRPSQISGGQQQRVALARALVNRPAVLLLDEPLGALDYKLRQAMQFELKALQHEVGITFIYVTHDQEEALTMSDRIAIMNQGQVLQVGTPVQIYERPVNRFVANFIGETNFLQGRVIEVHGNRCVVEVASGVPVVGSTYDGVQVGDRVSISIRPEKIRIHESQPDPRPNLFEVRVETVAYIGSDTQLQITMPHGDRLRVYDQNDLSTVDESYFYAAGDQAWISWRPENALVLKN
ncbi:MAG: ABC transporter ATP-binding protein [Caldilineales bacterium]|nr:ABC transporter ATP-binding protein [Caldilineales bacterium]MDW8317835.1 ABC transporter ATP-binding protein [Anaerolineae bacterium]